MEHRALEHRGRKVGERAAVREEAQLRRDDAAVAIEADAILGPVGMALAGRAHVVVFAVDDARGATGAIDHQRGHHRRDRGLRFLAAEAAAHALADADHLVLAAAQHLGDDGLDLGRVLRRGVDDDLARFARARRGRPGSRGRTAPARRSGTRLRSPRSARGRMRRRDRRARCGARRRGRDRDASASSIESTGGSSSMSSRIAARAARAAARDLGGDHGDRLADVAHAVATGRNGSSAKIGPNAL